MQKIFFGFFGSPKKRARKRQRFYTDSESQQGRRVAKKDNVFTLIRQVNKVDGPWPWPKNNLTSLQQPLRYTFQTKCSFLRSGLLVDPYKANKLISDDYMNVADCKFEHERSSEIKEDWLRSNAPVLPLFIPWPLAFCSMIDWPLVSQILLLMASTPSWCSGPPHTFPDSAYKSTFLQNGDQDYQTNPSSSKFKTPGKGPYEW